MCNIASPLHVLVVLYLMEQFWPWCRWACGIINMKIFRFGLANSEETSSWINALATLLLFSLNFEI